MGVMNLFSSSTSLREMIKTIWNCKTETEEEAIVLKEIAAIKSALKHSLEHSYQDYGHRDLSKLMFIHMLGYRTDLKQKEYECFKLIACPHFPRKRIGYLGLMLLVDEKKMDLPLVTQLLKLDLNCSDKNILGLALCALGNICSKEMAHDLAPEVEKLLLSEDPNIRKKAALCSAKIIRKVPELAESFIGPAATLLKESHHGVLITGVQLCTEICKASTEALQYLRMKHLDGLIQLLKDLTACQPFEKKKKAPEHGFSGIEDPLLQIRILRLLRMLGQAHAECSNCLDNVLTQVATRAMSNKNAGNAILYECVACILGIEANNGLRTLAINILDSFLSGHDKNNRYVALNMLVKAHVLDIQAVQRHCTTILGWIKGSDISLRKGALKLVSLLANDGNVKLIVKELIDFLKVCEATLKTDLTSEICSLVRKFPQDSLWYINQMLKVLYEAGNHVKDDIWHDLIAVISRASDLHGYTARSLYRALQTSCAQENLVRVAVWSFGSYGQLLVNNVGMLDGEEPMTVIESDVVQVIEIALKCHVSDVTTQAMSLVALLKLSLHFSSCFNEIREVIVRQKGITVLELQHRSIKFSCKYQNRKETMSILVRWMTEWNGLAHHRNLISSSPATVSSMMSSDSHIFGAPFTLPSGVAQSSTTAHGDLFYLTEDTVPAPGFSAGDFLQDILGLGIGRTPPIGDADVLVDLLSIETPPLISAPNNELTSHCKMSTVSPLETQSSAVMNQSQSSAGAAPVMALLDGLTLNLSLLAKSNLVYPSIVAYQSNSLKVIFNFSKHPKRPQRTLIHVTLSNLSSNTFRNFQFDADMDEYELQIDKPSGSVLPPFGSGLITQSMRFSHSQHGQEGVPIHMTLSYEVNKKRRTEYGYKELQLPNLSKKKKNCNNPLA